MMGVGAKRALGLYRSCAPRHRTRCADRCGIARSRFCAQGRRRRCTRPRRDARRGGSARHSGSVVRGRGAERLTRSAVTARSRVAASSASNRALTWDASASGPWFQRAARNLSRFAPAPSRNLENHCEYALRASERANIIEEKLTSTSPSKVRLIRLVSANSSLRSRVTRIVSSD